VLIFDAAREVFVLHKVDSTFDMNLTRTPSNGDAESLRKEHPYLKPPKITTRAKEGIKEGGAKQKKAPAAKETKGKKSLPMPEKKEQPAPAPKSKRPTPDSEEEDDDDDDFGLTIENPGGTAPRAQPSRDFSPVFETRRFSEFVQQNNDNDEDENDDADGEDDGEESDDGSVEHFKLPSPMNRQMEATAAAGYGGGGSNSVATRGRDEEEEEEEEEESEEDEQMVDVEPGLDDADLEAELMAALDEEQGPDQESDVSEEE
jgi:hypothetical protein